MTKTIDRVLIKRDPIADEVPVVFDSPHSGTTYPDDFGHAISMADLRKAEDTFVDDLYEDAPHRGAHLLVALFPRAYIDPNRSVLDINPDLLDDAWPDPLAPGEKTRIGHGLIWSVSVDGNTMYDRKLGVAEVRNRVDTFYQPYHGVLKETLDDVHRRHGRLWHIDCHSTTSVSTENSPEGRAGVARADFILGDRDGTACDPAFTAFVKDVLSEMGYTVKLNDPFKGVELVRAYSDPAANRHSLQVEINRVLYMDENTLVPHEGYAKLKANVTRMIEAICNHARKV
jgi:N-formylglutamate deformylase